MNVFLIPQMLVFIENVLTIFGRFDISQLTRKSDPSFRLELMKMSKKQKNKMGTSRTLIPFVSSSSKFPISKASAALTSPRGGMRGGGYFNR